MMSSALIILFDNIWIHEPALGIYYNEIPSAYVKLDIERGGAFTFAPISRKEKEKAGPQAVHAVLNYWIRYRSVSLLSKRDSRKGEKPGDA